MEHGNQQQQKAKPTWLTTQEMADRLRVHQVTLVRLARAGHIPAAKVGRTWRWPAESVEEALLSLATRCRP